MSLTDVGADSARESQSNGSGDDGSDWERFDLTGSSFGLQHPASAVRGEAVALRKLWDDDDPDRSDVAVILDDPSVVSDDDLSETVVVESDEEGDDFKVVNLADDQSAALGPGGKIDDPDEVDDLSGLMGIDFAGNTFYGSVRESFEETDRAALKRGGGAGRSIASTLDVNGATSARVVRDENGDVVLHDGGHPKHNGGLVEYHPDGYDGEAPRYSRHTELRPDVAGNEIVVMLQRLADVDEEYDGNAYWATVFASLDGDRQAELAERYAEQSDDEDATANDFIVEIDGDRFLRLKPTDEFEPDEGLIRESAWLEWQTLDYDDPEDVAELNEARVDAGFDPYSPDRSGSSDSESEAEAE